MKKVLSTLLFAGMLAIYACGPGAEEKAAADKAAQDSIAAAQQTANTIAAGDTMAKAMADTSKMKMETPAKK
ncbi:MAG: hypothetical protein NT126_11800 [Bacteroidetes bacterium]|nr:hypothetical protein [Bacteroidota bacterium]